MAETLSTGESRYWPIYGSNTTERNIPYASLLRLLRYHSPTSSHLFGFLALLISGGLLTFLLGVTVTATAFGFIAFLPLIIISGPIWLPGSVLVGGCLTVVGFLVGTVAIVSWTYRYFRECTWLDRIKWTMHVVGSMTQPRTSKITLESTVDTSTVGLKMQPLVLNLNRSVLSG
ncbi:hypothetical protein Bca52824_086284 [Brassica carinata]|uniref:Oleosin n=1 Tax=Brassica carinata TaxID=52824 RepID=A0A8X7P7J3_BRACI|nr:hypothetical protein Bca52824_086284 [Brassica carinata]